LFILLISSIYTDAQFVYLKGRQFIDGSGSPFFPMVMNYSARLVHDPLNSANFKIIRDRAIGSNGDLLEPVSRYKWSNCELSLEDDFEKIKEMGFNSIRLILTPNRLDLPNHLGGFSVISDEFSTTTMGNPTKQQILYLGPSSSINYSGGQSAIFFNLVAHVLDIAASHNIKVILLCANHSGSTYPEMGSSDSDAADYSAYLSALAYTLKDKTALMAYDLYNEPSFLYWSSAKTMNKPKETICQYVSQWYDAIKTVDKNHLITIGGIDVYDAVAWDPGVMKIDFVSMHIYPYKDIYVAPNSTLATEIVVNQIKWATNAYQKPWIIGETGFITANDKCLIPALWGNVNEQYNYVSAILPALRDCGASGFSWWNFQDVHYYCIPDVICYPTCKFCYNEPGYDVPGLDSHSWCGKTSKLGPFDPVFLQETINNVPGNFFGLLGYGDPNNSDGKYSSTFNKEPTSSYIKNFLNLSTGVCPSTTNYYNPKGFPTSSESRYGTVLDTRGIPIKDAVIIAHTNKTVNPTRKDDYNIFTFSNSAGYFILNPPPGESITNMLITAIGAEKKSRTFPINNGEIFRLNKVNINFDEIINSVIVNPPTKEYFKGWNTLTVSNLIINAGASVDIKARSEIHVLPEMQANFGSSVHIYCAQTFSDCSDFTLYTDRAIPNDPEIPYNFSYTPKMIVELNTNKY